MAVIPGPRCLHASCREAAGPAGESRSSAVLHCGHGASHGAAPRPCFPKNCSEGHLEVEAADAAVSGTT